MHIHDLDAGDLVGKTATVGFGVPGPSRFASEWIRVRITQVVGKLIYGILCDEPLFTTGLRKGDVVCFEAGHVQRGEVHAATRPPRAAL